MVTDGLHIFLLTQSLAADLLAAMGDRHHRAKDLVDHIDLAFPRQCNGITDAATVHQITSADHIAQLGNNAFRQFNIVLFTGDVQFSTAQGHVHGTFLLNEGHVLIIEAK